MTSCLSMKFCFLWEVSNKPWFLTLFFHLLEIFGQTGLNKGCRPGYQTDQVYLPFSYGVNSKDPDQIVYVCIGCPGSVLFSN